MHNFNLIFSGHVDHGKSTLIGRLMLETKSLPADKLEGISDYSALVDNFFEEKAEARTIDTTQMFLCAHKRRYAVIDVPGHLEFIKNMLTGASEADAAVLIIDAAEGPRSETIRHLCLLSFVGVREIIVVFNKMDLVDYKAGRYDELRRNLSPIFTTLGLAEPVYIPISALHGKNIIRRSHETKWHRGPTLLKAMAMLKGRTSREHSSFILPIQDIYKRNGAKIFVGRVESGCVRPGQGVKIVPSGIRSSVKSIEKFGKTPSKSTAGESIGITFKDEINSDRGDIVCDTDAMPTVSDSLDVNLFWLSPSPLKVSERLSLRCSTQETDCAITEITGKSRAISNAEFSRVKIVTKRPIAVMPFDTAPFLGRIVLFKDQLPCAAATLAP